MKVVSLSVGLREEERRCVYRVCFLKETSAVYIYEKERRKLWSYHIFDSTHQASWIKERKEQQTCDLVSHDE
jgi:hypothetical protein